MGAWKKQVVGLLDANICAPNRMGYYLRIEPLSSESDGRFSVYMCRPSVHSSVCPSLRLCPHNAALHSYVTHQPRGGRAGLTFEEIGY